MCAHVDVFLLRNCLFKRCNKTNASAKFGQKWMPHITMSCIYLCVCVVHDRVWLRKKSWIEILTSVTQNHNTLIKSQITNGFFSICLIYQDMWLFWRIFFGRNVHWTIYISWKCSYKRYHLLKKKQTKQEKRKKSAKVTNCRWRRKNCNGSR